MMVTERGRKMAKDEQRGGVDDDDDGEEKMKATKESWRRKEKSELESTAPLNNKKW